MKHISIGRNSSNDVVINHPNISANHALLIIKDNGEVILRDLNSTNGTYVNSNKIKETVLTPSDKVQLDTIEFNWREHTQQRPASTKILSPLSNINSITIGRSPKNQLVIDSSDVSSFHATINRTDDGEVYINDLNSTNGIYVNGQKISSHRLRTGDKVLLSNKYHVDWEKFYNNSANSNKIQPHKKLIYISLLAILLIILSILNFNTAKQFIVEELFASDIDVNEKYKTSVVLIYQTFIYEVQLAGEKYQLTKIDGEFTSYEAGKTPPIQITGTGFFVSNSGEIITNRHVAIPWEYSDDKDEVKNSIEEYFKQISFFANYAGQYEIYKALKDLEVTGKSLSIGIALNDSYVTSESDFIPCVFIKESGKQDTDVALIQTKSKTLPAQVKQIINLSEAVNNEMDIKVGEPLLMIGYPAGFTLASTKKGLMANFQTGQVTRLPDGLNFGHNIATIGGGSGSPIFTKQGKLIGVNYEGLMLTQGFNKAILAKHAFNLLND